MCRRRKGRGKRKYRGEGTTKKEHAMTGLIFEYCSSHAEKSARVATILLEKGLDRGLDRGDRSIDN